MDKNIFYENFNKLTDDDNRIEYMIFIKDLNFSYENNIEPSIIRNFYNGKCCPIYIAELFKYCYDNTFILCKEISNIHKKMITISDLLYLDFTTNYENTNRIHDLYNAFLNQNIYHSDFYKNNLNKKSLKRKLNETDIN